MYWVCNYGIRSGRYFKGSEPGVSGKPGRYSWVPLRTPTPTIPSSCFSGMTRAEVTAGVVVGEPAEYGLLSLTLIEASGFGLLVDSGLDSCDVRRNTKP